jgi:hypothetical protein
MSEPLFKVGQEVWIHKPWYAEHGCRATVIEAAAPWTGPLHYDTYEYGIDVHEWAHGGGPPFRATVGERMLRADPPVGG